MGGYGHSVQQTKDGGYIIVGTKYFLMNYSVVYLIRTDANGDTLWSKTFGGSDDKAGYSVQQTNDDGYIIVGYDHSSSVSGAIYLIKTDANGDSLWTRTYSSWGGGWVFDTQQENSIQQTNDGGYIIAGTMSFGGDPAICLIRSDANGDTLWIKVFDGYWGRSVQQTNDDGYIIAGTGGGDVYLIRTDTNGDTLWTNTFGGANNDEGYSVQQTNDGGYIIAGSTRSFGAGLADVYLIKTDVNGGTLWMKTFGGANEDESYSVQQTSDGGYIIAGVTASFGNGIYLIKTDSLGNSLTNTVSGNIFIDPNPNCIKDIGEQGLKNWLTKISPNEKYATADSNGFYSVLVDSGTYTVSQITSHPY